jgi:hypothetical protein
MAQITLNLTHLAARLGDRHAARVIAMSRELPPGANPVDGRVRVLECCP